MTMIAIVDAFRDALAMQRAARKTYQLYDE
jgi:hypothetical protein